MSSCCSYWKSSSAFSSCPTLTYFASFLFHGKPSTTLCLVPLQPSPHPPMQVSNARQSRGPLVSFMSKIRIKYIHLPPKLQTQSLTLCAIQYICLRREEYSRVKRKTKDSLNHLVVVKKHIEEARQGSRRQGENLE